MRFAVTLCGGQNAAFVLSSASIAAIAAPVTPTYTMFSNLAGATYGGSGIPTDPSAITTVGTPARATWNFDFYINDSANNLNANGLTYKLFYDFDAGVGTDQSQLGVFDLSFFANGNTYQDSQNLSFAYLSASSFFITPPAMASFDALAEGEYSFALVAYRDGAEVARSAILVDVGTVNVPEPGSIALPGFGLAGLGFVRRRMQK